MRPCDIIYPVRPRWARAAALLLLLFALGVLTATLMFVTGGIGNQDGLPVRDPRSDEVVVNVKPVRLSPATRQVELLFALDPATNDSPVELSLTGRDGETVDVALPPSETVMVTTETNPQAFPDDSYRLELAFVSTGAPVSVSMQPNPSLVDWRVSALEACGGCVGLVFQRPAHVRFFVYGVALAPLLLGLSAALHWLSDRSSRSAPIELGAALLALLPLRDVLVPDDIPGITRLDHLLGAEVVLIAVAVAVVTAMALWRRASAAQTAEPASEPASGPWSGAAFDAASDRGFTMPATGGVALPHLQDAGDTQGLSSVPSPRSAGGADDDSVPRSGLVGGEGEADVPDGGEGERRDEGADRSGGDRGQPSDQARGRQA